MDDQIICCKFKKPVNTEIPASHTQYCGEDEDEASHGHWLWHMLVKKALEKFGLVRTFKAMLFL